MSLETHTADPTTRTDVRAGSRLFSVLLAVVVLIGLGVIIGVEQGEAFLT